MKIQFLTDLEFLLEVADLKRIGLTDEEIAGYFELYAVDWVVINREDKNHYVN